MNIFFLDLCPVAAARAQVRKSAIKMVLESAQLLSTAVLALPAAAGVDKGKVYRSTHYGHPSARWTRRSSSHFLWLVAHAKELCRLFADKSGRPHKSETVIDYCAAFADRFPDKPLAITASDLAIMSTELGRAAMQRFLESAGTAQDAVAAYRSFYFSKPYVVDAMP